MYIKNAITILFLILSTTLFAQIKIDDVGDGWKSKVDSALRIIEKTDQEVYKEVISNCNYITFWLGNFSTTTDSSTIMISTKDMKIGSVNNIACIIVHESHHLLLKKNKVKMSPKDEELACYMFEYEFLKKIPNPEDWLTIHVIKCILKFKD